MTDSGARRGPELKWCGNGYSHEAHVWRQGTQGILPADPNIWGADSWQCAGIVSGARRGDPQ